MSGIQKIHTHLPYYNDNVIDSILILLLTVDMEWEMLNKSITLQGTS